MTIEKGNFFTEKNLFMCIFRVRAVFLPRSGAVSVPIEMAFRSQLVHGGGCSSDLVVRKST